MTLAFRASFCQQRGTLTPWGQPVVCHLMIVASRSHWESGMRRTESPAVSRHRRGAISWGTSSNTGLSRISRTCKDEINFQLSTMWKPQGSLLCHPPFPTKDVSPPPQMFCVTSTHQHVTPPSHGGGKWPPLRPNIKPFCVSFTYFTAALKKRWVFFFRRGKRNPIFPRLKKKEQDVKSEIGFLRKTNICAREEIHHHS